MKKQLLMIMAVCAGMFFALSSAFAQDAAVKTVTDDDIRQAFYGALDNAKTAMKTAPFSQKTVAVLPFQGNWSSVIDSRLKNIITENGFTCVEAKSDPMWDEIVKEIAWDERKDDILDAKTVVKFGKLKAAQILLYGRVVVLDKTEDRVYAEIELHATDIATKQHVWGGNFAFRFYVGQDVNGIIELNHDLRMLLKKNFEEAKNSMLQPMAAAKMDKIKTVTVIPLAGDIDQYMTGLAFEVLTQTQHMPKNPQIPSLAQVRAFARDGKLESDGIFYGAVRDLRKSKTIEYVVPEQGVMRSEYTVYADIQLYLEDAGTGIVLWSRTITIAETYTGDRALPPPPPLGFWEEIRANWQYYAAIVGGAVVGIIVLILLLVGIKSYFSYNHVR